MSPFFATSKATKLEAQFVAALHARFLQPWHQSVRWWLQRQGDQPPRLGTLTSQLRMEVAPNRAVLEDILSEYHLAAADLGGQHAIDTIRAALREQGQTWEQRAREAVNETLAERLARGEGVDAPTGAFTFHLRDKRLLTQLKKRGTKVTGEVTKTMLQDLRGVLSREVYQKGQPPAAVAKQLDEIFPPTYANRGLTIARTETGFAQTATALQTYEENGVAYKEWLAFVDGRTRPDHAAANGQVQPVNEPFRVGGALLMRPLDPAGPPEQVINCRCDVLPVISGDMDLPRQPWLGWADVAQIAAGVLVQGE